MARAAGEYVPAGHAVHERFSSYVPRRQGVHWRIVNAPRTTLRVPFGQGRQSATDPLKMLSRYVWNGQSWQELDCAGVNLPSRQRSHPELPAPAVYVPAVQSRQTVAPSMGKYLPAWHGMHWREASYVPGGQAVHANLDGAPSNKEYVPGLHGWQSVTAHLYCSSRYV